MVLGHRWVLSLTTWVECKKHECTLEKVPWEQDCTYSVPEGAWCEAYSGKNGTRRKNMTKEIARNGTVSVVKAGCRGEQVEYIVEGRQRKQ